jgi:predicted nuclease of predicted toxin-antitoxin system
VRFFLDHDVSAEVARRLRQARHECWTASEAGLSEASDDDLTVYAGHMRAVLVAQDRKFSQRRRGNVVGRHVQLRCQPWEAADLLEAHLAYVLDMAARFEDVFIAISHEGCDVSHGWQ